MDASIDRRKRVYIETYGCQMNIADTEVVQSLISSEGHELTDELESADVVLVNTCSIREHAEQRVFGRLGELKKLKEKKPALIVGVLGCMAERLRTRISAEKSRGVGHIVDIIVGPDEYRKVPGLLHKAWHGERGIAVRLSRVETYDDVMPLRTDGISAWISVMRGCDKFCTFCVVPFTRGRERSRSLKSIVDEVGLLADRGFREVTLLGQNVNSYADEGRDFADLLQSVAAVDNDLRVRFTTSHPRDMSQKLIDTIASHANICKYIHLPLQSGSDRILELMNRTYGATHYLRLMEKIRTAIPDISLSTDIIAGFPTETDDDHRLTLDMLRNVQYDGAFTFKYSPRENTPAFSLEDTVTEEIKTLRINEIIALQQEISAARNRLLHGREFVVLVEGESKKSSEELQGRTDGNKTVIFRHPGARRGDYVKVAIRRSNSATLFGEVSEDASVLTGHVGEYPVVM